MGFESSHCERRNEARLQCFQLLNLEHVCRSKGPHAKHGDHAMQERKRIHLRRVPFRSVTDSQACASSAAFLDVFSALHEHLLECYP